MKNNFPKLLVEINNFELIFVVIEINENEPDNEIPEPSAACAAIDVPDIITELDEIRNLYIAPTSKIFKKHEKAAQIRSAKIIDKQVHDIIGSDVPWGKNRLVVKYTLSRLKSDIKSRVIRLSASPPLLTPPPWGCGPVCRE